MRVVVVGAGVVGVSVAHALHARGASVTLVEAVGPGAGTSSRGAGIVSEAAWHPTSMALVQRSMELMQDMSDAARARGAPFRYHETGSTSLVPDDLVDAARELARGQGRHAAEVREVAPADVPALPRHAGIDITGVATAFHYPRDGWALPRLYCELLASELAAAGVETPRAAARLDVREGRAVVQGFERADAVVLAAGVHTRTLLQGAGLDAPLLAYRTQATGVMHPRAHEVPILHDGVLGWYLRPSQHGELLAGNGTTTTPEEVDKWNAVADASFVEKSAARVRARFPFLATCTAGVSARAGLDAATPDRLMLAGAYPRVGGLFLAVGGNGHGFMRAPALGESLAAVVMGAKPRIALNAYDPARFAGATSADFEIREGYSIEGSAFK